MPPPVEVMRWKDHVRATLVRLNLHTSLNPNLVLSLIWKESAGNPYAFNPERRYPWLWDVKRDTPFREGKGMTEAELASRVPPPDFPCLGGDPDHEWWGQAISWGLTQVMGAAAREQRFRGIYLLELSDPYTNIEFGARHLWHYCYQRGNYSMPKALGRWNVNAGYANDVLEKFRVLETTV